MNAGLTKLNKNDVLCLIAEVTPKKRQGEIVLKAGPEKFSPRVLACDMAIALKVELLLKRSMRLP